MFDNISLKSINFKINNNKENTGCLYTYLYIFTCFVVRLLNILQLNLINFNYLFTGLKLLLLLLLLDEK
jgi:hypothetical protein